jgi:hypothetical protein
MSGMVYTGGDEGKARPSVEESVRKRLTGASLRRLAGVSRMISIGYCVTSRWLYQMELLLRCERFR